MSPNPRVSCALGGWTKPSLSSIVPVAWVCVRVETTFRVNGCSRIVNQLYECNRETGRTWLSTSSNAYGLSSRNQSSRGIDTSPRYSFVNVSLSQMTSSRTPSLSARDMYRGKSNVASFDQTGLTVFLRVGVRNRSRSTVTTTNLRGSSQQYRNRRGTFDNVRPAQTNDRRVAAVHNSSSRTAHTQ